MTETPVKRDRRDWTMITLLLPIGIILMLIAGQVAIRLVPNWRVNAGMESSLDPESASADGPLFFQPISFDILTPMKWLDTFLTPGPDSVGEELSFAPFVVFEPSATPSPAIEPTASTSPPPPSDTPTASPPPTTSATPTRTPRPGTPTPVPPVLCQDPTANNVGSPVPCTYNPIPSPLVGASATVPPETNIGTPDNSVGNIDDGTYILINLPTPIVVVNSLETNYDFVYYELPNGSGILMDRVIISISTASAGTYYVVFNWGDGIPDDHSNVGDVARSTGTENDNQSIDQPDTGVLHGTGTLDTGIAVDVDNAPSHPPAGSYPWVAIQAPPTPPAANGTDGADVDAIQVTEVAP